MLPNPLPYIGVSELSPSGTFYGRFLEEVVVKKWHEEQQIQVLSRGRLNFQQMRDRFLLTRTAAGCDRLNTELQENVFGVQRADILSPTTACTRYFKGREHKKLCIGIICRQRKFLPNARQFAVDLSPRTGKFMCLFKKPSGMSQRRAFIH